MGLLASDDNTPIRPSNKTPDNTTLEPLQTDAPQVLYSMTHQTSHVTHTLSLLHALAFIREIFDDSTVRHIIDDDKQSADRYRQLKGLFMAAVVDNSPDDALNAYMNMFNYSIELCLKNDCDFFDVFSHKPVAVFDIAHFNRFLNKVLTKLTVKLNESCEDKEPSNIEENSEVKTDEDASTAHQVVINISKIVNTNHKVYNRKSISSRKITINHGFGNTLSCYFADTEENLAKITFNDLRANIGKKICYFYTFVKLIKQQSHSSKQGDSLLSISTKDYTIIDDSTQIFTSKTGATDTNSSILVSLARLSPNIEDYDDISTTVDKKTLETFTFAVDGIYSGVYFTMAYLGLRSIIHTVTKEVTKLVSEDNQAKVKEMISPIIKNKRDDYEYDFRYRQEFNSKINFNLNCTLPSKPTSDTLNFSSSLVEQFTDAVDLCTDLSNQPSFILFIDDYRLSSDHTLSAILGDMLTFDSHAISYRLVQEVKVADKTELYYELTHQINDD